LHLGAIFVEEGVLPSPPGDVAQRVAAAPALGQPQIPLAVDIGVMEIEDRILRGSGHAAHPAADLAMHAAVGALNGQIGGDVIGVGENRIDAGGQRA